MLNNIQLGALEYVRNTDGWATKENFIDDYEPIGEALWRGLVQFIFIDRKGKIHLTEEGNAALDK